MEPFTTFTGITVPLDRANVDTDLIIPKQFLKSVKRTGFGPHLFDQLRYHDEGQPGMDCNKREKRKDFILNQPRYQGATVLLARENFGCGSSREHAPWALLDYGFKTIIAPSFADIFYNNCFKNGILPITLDEQIIDELFEEVNTHEGYTLEINLVEQRLSSSTAKSYTFAIEDYRRNYLLEGLDDIGLTLKQADRIREYEQTRKIACPWMFEDIAAIEKR